MKSFIVDKNSKLSKLVLLNIPDLPYSAFMRSLRRRDVKVNGVRVSEDVFVSVGDKVEIYYQPIKIEKYSTVYSDDNVIVINKKSGYTSEEVFDSVKESYLNARFIHRLDRNTSGIMIFALSDVAEKELLKGFKQRTFDKKYRALVIGKMEENQKILTAYLVKDSNASLVKIFDKAIKGSVQIKTGYKVLKFKDGLSLLEVTLYTGKTHQIRAHLAHIGHPIVGDGKYGDFAQNQKLKAKKQNLTAYSLTLHFEKESALSYLNQKTFSVV